MRKPVVRIERATPAEIEYVARNMRQRDFEEFSALSWENGREALARDLAHRFSERSDTLCAALDEPIAIGMTVLNRPRVITLGFFATDRFPEIAIGVTRFVRELLERFESVGVHRIEAVSLDGHEQAHRWLGLLGLEPETGPLRNYGRSGETFKQFVRVKNAGPSGLRD